MSQSISFWEREELLQTDFLVVGAGIIGLSTAISIKENFPKAEVLILEREILPSGASSKNAGFACFGSLTEFLADLDNLGPEKTIEIVAKRKNGFELLMQRLGADQLGYDRCGGFELLWDKDSIALERLELANELLKSVFGLNYFAQSDNLIDRFGFNSEQVKHLVSNQFEGTINTGQMIKNLTLYAAEKRIRIIFGAEVLKIQDNPQAVKICVKRAASSEALEFSSGAVVVATNALAPSLSKPVSLSPGRGQVCITKPIPNLKVQGAFFFDQGFYYFRNVDNRILFGGGRNSDFTGETTAEFNTTAAIQNRLEELLRTTILPKTDFQIDLRWSGIMGFSESHQPIIKKISPNVVLAFGCNGMGVALGTAVGTEAAALFC